MLTTSLKLEVIASGMPCNDDMLHFMQIVDIENSYVLKQNNK